jgi:twitching motility two-component system response regulator PilH
MSIVLIVDDAKTDLELIAQIVNATGHRAVLATNGSEAIELARLHKPALIFLDVVMPVMDGYATCRNLSKDPSTASIPVVLVTSKSQDSDVFWGKKQGAAGHISKPWNQQVIEDTIRKYC